ncbi:DUF2752 domain-containing protein [Streptomyces sp. NBC_01591]|uniref:DUF2752 domain-containing protein n=1 Tax=Streptomyces sp. NBC_01591 TaxID=2975888 RepID=UPI002DD9058C|nr:DUF2752 domain-containing protein [Streptomyces sp. NBC_01591]WSD67896.1 DUF2752 domain-containing protein [Streptomyces sp. NBC_01591]
MDASPTPAAAVPAPASGPGPGRPSPPVFPPAPVPPVPASRVRRLATPVGVMAVVVGTFGYVGAVDPNQPGHYPLCPLLRFTGLYCPGCGGLRSAHAVAHGDIAAALGSNALAVVGYAVFAVLWTVWTVRAARGRPMSIAAKPAVWWGIGAVLLIFSVVRNLPIGSVLAP